MSRTAKALFIDGQFIGYFPPADAEQVPYGNSNVKEALDGLSSGKVSKSGDTMNGDLTFQGSSNDSPDVVFRYGNGNEKMRLWTDDTYTSRKGINYRIYKNDGTSIYNGQLATVADIFDSLNPFAYRGVMGADVVSTDFNDYTTGTYRSMGTNTGGGYSNAPHSADNGWLICFTESAEWYQFWISTYRGESKYRRKSNNTWGSWTTWNF